MTEILSQMCKFVMNTVQKHNIDESHGLSHAMNILIFSNQIFKKEVRINPSIQSHEKIIYISAVLHDMCDNKYMDKDEGMCEINKFIQDIDAVTPHEIDVIDTIISTMSYSTVKVNGFPEMGEYQTAYNIVRESDLLCAYDFDRCMIYNLYGNNTGNIGAAYNDASNLFQTRVFKHNQDGLLLTKSAQTMSIELEQKSVERMKHWENLLSNGVV